jgi:hypothetical protein
VATGSAVIPLKLPGPLLGTLAQPMPKGLAVAEAALPPAPLLMLGEAEACEAGLEAALDAVPLEPQAAAPRLRPAATTAVAMTRDFTRSSLSCTIRKIIAAGGYHGLYSEPPGLRVGPE